MAEEKINQFNAPEDRRRFPRLATSVDVEYTILKETAKEKKSSTKNISAGGICLIVYEKINPGTLLALKLRLTDIHYVLEAKGRVVWSSYFTVGPDGRDRYDLGIEFTDIDEAARQKVSRYVFRLI